MWWLINVKGELYQSACFHSKVNNLPNNLQRQFTGSYALTVQMVFWFLFQSCIMIIKLSFHYSTSFLKFIKQNVGFVKIKEGQKSLNWFENKNKLKISWFRKFVSRLKGQINPEFHYFERVLS